MADCFENSLEALWQEAVEEAEAIARQSDRSMHIGNYVLIFMA